MKFTKLLAPVAELVEAEPAAELVEAELVEAEPVAELVEARFNENKWN